jgi:hypothetical protein
MQLKRLILTFRESGELVINTSYSTQGDGPNPSTKARTRQVTELTRRGLRDACKALEGGAAVCVGTSGFVERQDVLSVDRRATEKVSA